MKQEEKELMVYLYTNLVIRRGSKSVRQLLEDQSLPEKKALKILEKWSDKDLYEYGTTLDLGWFTSEGLEKAKELYDAAN